MSSPESERATLLVSCPDRRGIVAALAQVLYGHGANIFDSDQHTDTVAAQFFQRLHFDLADLQTDRGTLERAISEVAERFSMRYELRYQKQPKRVALFVSRYDHCLYDLLLRQQSGELRCELPLIVSNHPELERVAQQFGVPFRLIPISAAAARTPMLPRRFSTSAASSFIRIGVPCVSSSGICEPQTVYDGRIRCY